MEDNYIVDGILRKTFVASIGGYKYHVANGRKVFASLTDAMLYCDKVLDLTGVVLAIR